MANRLIIAGVITVLVAGLIFLGSEVNKLRAECHLVWGSQCADQCRRQSRPRAR